MPCEDSAREVAQPISKYAADDAAAAAAITNCEPLDESKNAATATRTAGSSRLRPRRAKAAKMRNAKAVVQVSSLLETDSSKVGRERTLKNVQKVSRSGTTAFEQGIVALVYKQGLLGRFLLAMGGLYDFGSILSNRLYALTWVSAFAMCTLVCTANVVLAAHPFHSIVVDSMTAGIHIPVFLAWRFWRGCVIKEQYFRPLLKVYNGLSPETKALFVRNLDADPRL